MARKRKMITLTLRAYAEFDDTTGMDLYRARGEIWIPELPDELVNLSPNTREQCVLDTVYKNMMAAQRNEGVPYPNVFQLASKGMLVTTSEARVMRRGKDDWCKWTKVEVANDGLLYGCVDGGHNYRGAMLQKEEIVEWNRQNPDKQIRTCIPVEIIGGVDSIRGVDEERLVKYIGYGRNQNREHTLEDIMLTEGRFDGIFTVLGKNGVDSLYAHKGNQRKLGKAQLSVTRCVTSIEAMHPDRFPTNPPSSRLGNVGKVLSDFRLNAGVQEQFERMIPLSYDLEVLYETIAFEASSMLDGESYGNAFFEPRMIPKGGKKRYFPIIKREGSPELVKGAVHASMWALQPLLVENGEGFTWRGGFKNVLKVWKDCGRDMLKMIKEDITDSDGKQKPASSYFKQKDCECWHHLREIVVAHTGISPATT